MTQFHSSYIETTFIFHTLNVIIYFISRDSFELLWLKKHTLQI